MNSSTNGRGTSVGTNGGGTSTGTADTGEIPRRGGEGPAPLSFAQELLWLMDRASPGLTAWNVPRALRLRGALDVGALQRALDAFVERHEVLRTVFAGTDQEARQIVLPAGGVPVEHVDLSALDGEAQQRETDRLVHEHATTPFDLTKDLLLRARLIRLGEESHVLCLNSHHIVSDGWSKGVMFRELSAHYNGFRRGEPVELAPLPVQFADYAAWERAALHEGALAEPLAYWREQLSGTLPTLALPTDRPRPSLPSFEGARRVAVLPAPLVQAIGRAAQHHGVTPYMVLLAAYATLLHRYTGQDDIIIGSPIAGRLQAETEGLIGYFANTLVLRVRLDGDPTFAELLERVRDTALGAYDHQEVPFEKLVLELQKGEQLTHAPLFQVVLTMEDTMPASLTLDGITVETMGVESGATKFDLTLLVAEQGDGLRLSLWYRTDLFEPATVDRLLRHFRALLESVADDAAQRVSGVRMISAAEERELLEVARGASAPAPETPVHALFERAARCHPAEDAVRCGDTVLTYRELDARANQLANRLVNEGVTRGTPVGIALDRSAEMIVALLGVLKAGGAYVPLPPELPAPRLAQQIAESGVRLVVTTATETHRFATSEVTVIALDGDSESLGREPETAPGARVEMSDVAYVLFTSGSTGVPKGVAVTHANLAHYVGAISERLGVPGAGHRQANPAATAEDRWSFATVSTLGADLGNTAVFPALASGGALHVIPADVTTDPARYAEYMTTHAVDVLKITPNHLRALLVGRRDRGELSAVLPRRWIVFGGEACAWELAGEVSSAGRCRVLNHYGPTETTVGATTFEVTPESVAGARRAGAQTVPIGRPLSNVNTYVVDGHGHLSPRGIPGELWIGGEGVAGGYVNRPDLAAGRFLSDPFSAGAGARVYRTGDRVRLLPTGDLEFLGRLDDQVKIRGYRVELGEIEHVLVGHPGVAQGVLVARETAGEQRLVAYVVPRAGGYAAAHTERPTPEALRAWVAGRLPDYMVPSAVVLLDALPLTANGKIDRAALPPDEAASEADTYAAPESETERALAFIWEEVLKRERIGAHDDFLSMGGHSLLAIRVLGKISRTFGVRLPLRVLFEAPTIAQLARAVDAEVEAARARELETMLQSLNGMSDADVERLMAERAPDGGTA